MRGIPGGDCLDNACSKTYRLLRCPVGLRMPAYVLAQDLADLGLALLAACLEPGKHVSIEPQADGVFDRPVDASAHRAFPVRTSGISRISPVDISSLLRRAVDLALLIVSGFMRSRFVRDSLRGEVTAALRSLAAARSLR